jgi:hypothetical protein
MSPSLGEVTNVATVLGSGTFQQKLDLLKRLPVCPPSNATTERPVQIAWKSPYAVDHRAKKYFSKVADVQVPFAGLRFFSSRERAPARP